MSNSDSPFCFYPDAQRQVLENIKMLGQSPESGITFSPEQSVGCRMFALGDPVTGPHNKRHVLDMTGHVASMLFGYNHVALTGEAVERELALAAKTRFASGDFGTPFRGLLGPVFRRVVMQDVFTHSIFFTEGARAVECACKIAHYCRQSETSTELDKVGKWLTPDIGFHGRSVLALSLTTSYDVRKHKNMPYMDCVEKVSCPTILENENIEDLRAREDEALYEIQQKIKELG
ncbi:MAG: aminotransferase class III-fold pyridoxal phosphate-dependent enzyme, partial [Bdellovibrionales bacterium]|nr:aminotransferase class III-fold pyridoxal phosphate-dependent enzyme [Bdellovibrionales bacterium]